MLHIHMHFFPLAAVGSLPLPSDVVALAEEFNVGAVVNMCIEYSGPVQHYEEKGIQQLRLPTVDTCSPSKPDVGKVRGRGEGRDGLRILCIQK